MINLIHGEALEEMDKLIQDGVKVDAIIADIPYGSINSKSTSREKYAGQIRKINKSKADIETFSIDEMLYRIFLISPKSIYIFCGNEQKPKIYKYFDISPEYMVNNGIWHKTNPSPINAQHKFVSSYEDFVFAKRRKTFWAGKYEHNVITTKAGKSKLHPTQKPVELMEYLLKLSTKEGDTVLDFTMGSGTTGVACKNLNRKFIGIELDKGYFEIAKERIERSDN